MKNTGGQSKMPHVTRGDVLDDLGFSAEEVLEIKVKAEIFRELLRYIELKQYTQKSLGETLGLHQPDVSNLLRGRISRFSVGKLIQFAGKLNLGAEVRIIQPQLSQPENPEPIPAKKKLGKTKAAAR
jgi:predicted XRE-type DNA-binding protein